MNINPSIENVPQLPKLYWKMMQWGDQVDQQDKAVNSIKNQSNHNDIQCKKTLNFCNLNRLCSIKEERKKGFVKIDSLHRKLSEKENNNSYNQTLREAQGNAIIITKSGIKLERMNKVNHLHRPNFQSSVVYKL